MDKLSTLIHKTSIWFQISVLRRKVKVSKLT